MRRHLSILTGSSHALQDGPQLRNIDRALRDRRLAVRNTTKQMEVCNRAMQAFRSEHDMVEQRFWAGGGKLAETVCHMVADLAPHPMISSSSLPMWHFGQLHKTLAGQPCDLRMHLCIMM